MKEDSTHITLKIINGNTYFFILTDSIYIYIYIEYRIDGLYLEISSEDGTDERIRIKDDDKKILSFFFKEGVWEKNKKRVYKTKI